MREKDLYSNCASLDQPILDDSNEFGNYSHFNYDFVLLA